MCFSPVLTRVEDYNSKLRSGSRKWLKSIPDASFSRMNSYDKIVLRSVREDKWECIPFLSVRDFGAGLPSHLVEINLFSFFLLESIRENNNRSNVSIN